MLKTKFPLIFGRKGGEEFDILSSLSTPITQNNLVGLLEKLQQIKSFKEFLINELHSIIDLENDQKKRNKLLNFKRDFFNNRSLEKHDLTIKEYNLFCDKFELYSQEKTNYKKELEVYKEVFNQELSPPYVNAFLSAAFVGTPLSIRLYGGAVIRFSGKYELSGIAK